jgi:hypothetical protein
MLSRRFGNFEEAEVERDKIYKKDLHLHKYQFTSYGCLTTFLKDIFIDCSFNKHDEIERQKVHVFMKDAMFALG